jgi:hypothetical protein
MRLPVGKTLFPDPGYQVLRRERDDVVTAGHNSDQLFVVSADLERDIRGGFFFIGHNRGDSFLAQIFY